MEYDDVSLRPFLVGTTANCMAAVSMLAQIFLSLAFPQRFEEVQRLPIGGVLSDGKVAAFELHIADLPFPCVREHAELVAAVNVAILLATFAGEDEDGWYFAGRSYAALAAATKAIVNFRLTMVDAP
ncbi:hypothetical protein D9M70_594840 [compost metagenome]